MKVYQQEIQIPDAVREIYPFESRSGVGVQGYRVHYLDVEGRGQEGRRWSCFTEIPPGLFSTER